MSVIPRYTNSTAQSGDAWMSETTQGTTDAACPDNTRGTVMSQVRTWEPTAWQAECLPKTLTFRLLRDDERFGLATGDVLLCMRYRFDPIDKLTVVARESDGFDPGCNVYRSQVERVS